MEESKEELKSFLMKVKEENEREVDIFLKFPCFLYNPANVGNLISGSSAFSNPSLDI